MGERELPTGARVLDDAAPTWHLHTRDPKAVLAALAEAGVHRLWLEGGPTVAAAFVAAGLVDEVVAYVAPAFLGRGRQAVTDLGITTMDEALRLLPTDITVLGHDVRITAELREGSPLLLLRPCPDDVVHRRCPCRRGGHRRPRAGRGLMFTGIVEELGWVAGVESGEDSARLRLRGPTVTSDAGHGASIAVNGVCLTVVEHGGDEFSVDVMADPAPSSLGVLRPGDRVNLERAMPANGRFGGTSQGHGRDRRGPRPGAGRPREVVRFSLPADLVRYVVKKGSITVDGVTSPWRPSTTPASPSRSSPPRSP